MESAVPSVGIDPQLDSLRIEVQTLLKRIVIALAEGADGPMAARRMKQIQGVSEIGRDLMMVLGGPEVRRGRRRGLGGGGYAESYGPSVDDDDGLPIYSAGFTAATAVETFGAKILQEAMASLPQLIMAAQSPNLIRAVSTARSAGMNDVADELQRKLHEGLGIDYAVKIEPESLFGDDLDDGYLVAPRSPVNPVMGTDEEAA